MKKNDSPLGRRAAVRHLAVFAASAIAPTWLLAACKDSPKELSCADTTGLTADEISMRANLAYVDKSTDPAKQCAKCNFYKAGAPDACGSCTLVKGNINPAGSCKSYVAKPA